MGSFLLVALGVLLLALAFTALLVALDLFGPSQRHVVKKRLRSSSTTTAPPTEREVSRRLAGRDPALGAWRYLVPMGRVAAMRRDLALAGIDPSRLSALVMAKVLAPVLLLLPVVAIVQSQGSPIAWVVGLFVIVLAYFVPDLLVKSRAQERQEQIQRDLPDILDQRTISLEAGLGFESALARVGATNSGPLGQEIVRAVQDMTVGMPRRDAYEALSERSTVDDLRRFTRSIVQAEEFGVTVSQVVRTQAEEMRAKRRERAKEAAQKVPLKLLFPMLVCIFPVLFIVILTPAFINIGRVM